MDKSWTIWTKVGPYGQKLDNVDKSLKVWTKWDNMDKSWTIWTKVGKCGQKWIIWTKMDDMDKNWIIWTKVGQYGQNSAKSIKLDVTISTKQTKVGKLDKSQTELDSTFISFKILSKDRNCANI